MNLTALLIIFFLLFFAMIPISILVESMRPQTKEPEKLAWDKEIVIQHLDINGQKIRFIKTGCGPNLVLLHTLRTQFDIFHKMIGELSESFTVYAMDYPGHGWSDIPEADYTADFFVRSTESFLEELGINDALLAGVSIGGSIPLLIAGKNNQRVKGVVSINPYDYPGKGASRGNLVANFFMSIIFIPIIGETFMRMRIRTVEKIIFKGGVANPGSLDNWFLEEVFVVGERRGHLKAFINLIRNSNSFSEAHSAYKSIQVPVLLLYGDKDWSTQSERQRTASEIPSVKVETISNAGHFMSLEHPQTLNARIKNFANTL